MKVTDIVIILIFILPGILTEKIGIALGTPGDKKRSEFREVVNGILFSFPVVLVTSLILVIFYQIKNVSGFIDSFDSIKFTVIFTILSLILSVLLGIAVGLTEDKRVGVLNYIRKKASKNYLTNPKTCWSRFFDEKESRYVEVVKDKDITYRGFIEGFSTGQEEKELILSSLVSPSNYEEEYKKCFDEDSLKRVYINFEKNIVIKDYDMTKYKLWLDKNKEN